MPKKIKMKQHITPKQLNELSEKGKERLRKWWKPKYADFFYCFYQKKRFLYGVFDLVSASSMEKINDDDFPLLSIGQMIEFLDWPLVINSYVKITDRSEGWVVKKIKYTINEDKELCDALWKAVKEVLER